MPGMSPLTSCKVNRLVKIVIILQIVLAVPERIVYACSYQAMVSEKIDMRKKLKHHDGRTYIRLPVRCIELIDELVRDTMTTRSEYIRKAVYNELVKDGIKIA